MTLIELLVANVLALAMLGMTIATTMQTQRLFRFDSARLRVNQNLRGTLDLIGIGLRQAGERLPANFPAIEIINGTSGAPDELIIRRHLIDEVVTVCNSITHGSSSNTIAMSSTNPGASPACTYGGQTEQLNAYETYRTDNNNTVKLYIFNSDTGVGEYIDYTNKVDDGSSTMGLTIQAHAFVNDYNAETAAVYAMTEVKYSLLAGPDGLLQLVENGDIANPQNVVYGIADFQLRVMLTDDTFVDSFAPGQLWSNIQAVEVTLRGSETVKDQTITNVLSSRFYPRNVLSL